MPPSTFARKLLFLVFVIELGIASAWFSGWLSPGGRYSALVATICDLTVAFAIWASAPAFAKFFVPKWSDDSKAHARCAGIAQALACDRPIRIIPSGEFYASTLGITESASRIYITTGLLNNISDETLRFVLAHEMTHAREQHILTLFFYVTTASALNYIIGTWLCMALALLYFLAFRRYLEFRADAGAAKALSVEPCAAALAQLDQLVPGPALQRYLPVLFTYPNVDKRISAIRTGNVSVF